MDFQTKTGQVFLQPRKTNKKWKVVWLSLFTPSSSGVGRLEIRDSGGGGDHSPGVRRHHPPHGDKKVKVIRLSELISVLRLPPNAEACPMDNMAAFCVETQDRTLVFSALKDECVDWVDKLCHCSFQRESSGSTLRHMEENQIYASADEAPQFWVAIQRTDAATRCDLQGSYWLQASFLSEQVSFLSEQASFLSELHTKPGTDPGWFSLLTPLLWSLQRALTIEAGRRYDCGPGTFLFETQQAETIFSLMKSTITQKKPVPLGSQTKDGEKVPMVSIPPHSPLSQVWDRSILEKTQDRRSLVFDDGGKTREDPIGSSEAAPAPITLMPLPLIPTQQTNQSEAVYADPKVSVTSDLKPGPVTALYVDPVDVLPLKPPQSGEPEAAGTASSEPSLQPDVPDSVYAEVFDKISLDQNKPQTLLRAGKPAEEPIYTEPVSKTDEVSEPRGTPKPDPFAHLYAQVCKTSTRTSATISTARSTAASPSASDRTKNPAEDSLDDVIYENLGII
ncbi:docking protein 3-like [Kryptolebias marmoratus]|uniref:docking protein 3-like n=1 Tax=Kryptolebias marmoratus TaxID=37003 RepID=UPI0018ACF100|nr:docking protein 3-like [Kryptolebias marmoratus]